MASRQRGVGEARRRYWLLVLYRFFAGLIVLVLGALGLLLALFVIFTLLVEVEVEVYLFSGKHHVYFFVLFFLP